MDELNALPYLDAVIRETLRVHSPAPSTVRIAMRDDVLPLSKPFTDKRGIIQEGIRYGYSDPEKLCYTHYVLSVFAKVKLSWFRF